jgi:hypothetical protein
MWVVHTGLVLIIILAISLIPPGNKQPSSSSKSQEIQSITIECRQLTLAADYSAYLDVDIHNTEAREASKDMRFIIFNERDEVTVAHEFTMPYTYTYTTRTTEVDNPSLFCSEIIRSKFYRYRWILEQKNDAGQYVKADEAHNSDFNVWLEEKGEDIELIIRDGQEVG